MAVSTVSMFSQVFDILSLCIKRTPLAALFSRGLPGGMLGFNTRTTVFLLLCVMTSGCTNLLGTTSRSTASTQNTVSPSTGSGIDALTLSTVVRNSRQSNIFDLVGDGTGALGNFCVTQTTEGEDGATTASTGSTCTCQFSYIKADGSTEMYDVSTKYTEPNLIRCSFATVPKTVPYVNVRIHLTNADSYSNTVRFKFSGNGQFLDLTDARSFSQPFRYQCRDTVFMSLQFGAPQGANAAGKGIYDPILSEDPAIAFAWNFYASNMYAAAAAFVTNNEIAESGVGSICPATPNDPGIGTDLTLFSLAGDSSGSTRIFPPVGSAFDRSTFFLARQLSGVFNIPVNAYVAPGSISQAPTDGSAVSTDPGKPSPVGYGAAPTPLDDGTETCPDTSVQIPPGFKWVKLWQFRASLDPRNSPTSEAMNNTAIACNPGDYVEPNPSPSYTPVPYAKICEGGVLAAANDTVLANRIIYGSSSGGANTGSACVVLNHPDPSVAATACNSAVDGPGSGAGCTATRSGVQKSLYGLWPLASDVWRTQVNTLNGGFNVLCSNGNALDNLHMCAFGGSAIAPFDDNVKLKALEKNSRYDFVMVVSPPTINLRDMQDPSNSAVLPYIPYRYYPGKCVSGDPTHPAFAGDCGVSNRINYALKAHDVGLNGDASPTDSGRLPVFPVCALQPI